MVLPEWLLCLLWNPQRTVRADKLRVWGWRGSPRGTCPPLHIMSSMDRHGSCGGMHGVEAARVSPCQPQNWGDPICHVHLANTKGHSRGLLQHEKAGREPEQHVSREIKPSNGEPPQPCSTGASQRGLMLTHILPNLLQLENPTCKRNTSSSLTFLVKV